MFCITVPAAFVDYYADSYSSDDSLSFYFIFLMENAVEISGTHNEVCVCVCVCMCASVRASKQIYSGVLCMYLFIFAIDHILQSGTNM